MGNNVKTTVQTSPAPTGERQPLSRNYTISIPDATPEINHQEKREELGQAQPPEGQKILHTVSLTELYDTVYPPKEQVINGLLFTGVYLFAGAPKVGKSFFMAQLGYHVSRGLPLWTYPVSKGTVLYLALEDDYGRLQRRLSRMFGMESTGNLYFATRSHHLGDGLGAQLETFVNKHQNTNLIIIDTLQKVREAGGEKFSYANDYEIVASLKRFAEYFHVCIMVVHHTRKQMADDSFDTISGTNGLLGAADGAFIMQKEKRTDNKAVLDVVGRDQQDQRLHLVFDQERCIWNLTKAETELWKEPPDTLLDAVSTLVTKESPSWCGSATELLDLIGLDIQPNVLTRRLNVGADRLWKDYHIRYENFRNHAGRSVKFTLEEA